MKNEYNREINTLDFDSKIKVFFRALFYFNMMSWFGISFLPKKISHVKIPPIKCQGIKSDLVNFISSNIQRDGKGSVLSIV